MLQSSTGRLRALNLSELELLKTRRGPPLFSLLNSKVHPVKERDTHIRWFCCFDNDGDGDLHLHVPALKKVSF